MGSLTNKFLEGNVRLLTCLAYLTILGLAIRWDTGFDNRESVRFSRNALSMHLPSGLSVLYNQTPLCGI
jgi:hypothetical protein